MYFELEDADLALLLSRERRGGQVAIWSLVAIFLVPGLLDGSIALVTLGGALAVGATIATVRAFRRPPTAAVLARAPGVRYAPRPETRAGRFRDADARPPARRHLQPDAGVRGRHDPRPSRLPPGRPCARPERGTGTRRVSTGDTSPRRTRAGPRGACARR
jgi:hypothetical protein